MIKKIPFQIENTEVEVFIINIGDTLEYPQDYYRLHFPKRYENSGKFRFEEDKKRSLSVGILLFEVLGLEEKDISYGKYGKPYALNSDADTKKHCMFSISHSGDYAVLAVSDREIGVDIEKSDRDYRDVLRKVFTEDEIRFADNENAYIEIWTMKESVTKASGFGLNADLKSFSTTGLIKGERQQISGKEFGGKCIAFEGYALSCSVIL